MNDLRLRGLGIMIGMGLIFFLFIFRLFYLQVMSDAYAHKSEQTDMREIVLLPSRGIILDRNERIYVQNAPVFDVTFIPNRLEIPDTSILERYLGLDRETIRSRITKHKGIGKFQTQILEKQVEIKTAAKLQEQLWEFKGMGLTARNTREYLYPVGANFLGYINQVGPKLLEADPDNYYRSGDLTGISGIEHKYENWLRGDKGKKIILVDAFNREVSSFSHGKSDVSPVEGSDIQIGIDALLQVFGEQLMQNKRGSIVAIEPESGEILSFISAPGYDPNLLTGRELGSNYKGLVSDTSKPLFNRPLMAEYAPGSIFKMLQALASMSEDIISESTHFPCTGAWFRNGGKPHCHGAHGNCGLHKAIVQSCNPFFAENYYSFINHSKFPKVDSAYQRWYEIMKAYGIGQKLGVDIPNELSGNLPTKAYYNGIYGKGRWGGLTIYSNSIGRGEITMTPLQMANEAAMIANRGWYIQPHFIKAKNKENEGWEPIKFERRVVPGKPEQFEIVVNGMAEVVRAGTGTMARLDSIIVCGKTGTVENKIEGDHSVFIAFAPKDNPKIAIGVIVENAGWGGSWAAPIASLMIEQYLTGKISNQWKLDRILKADFVHKNNSLVQY